MSIPLNDGTSIPIIAFGSGTALFGKDASQSITTAIHAGFRHIDAAQMYKNEDTVGDGIAASGVPRSELYITTKLDVLPAGKTVRDTLVESLRKLKVDHVDLFLIHNPRSHKDLKSVWKQLEAAQAEGLTKSIGVSNFQPEHLKEVLEVATIKPAVNQIEFHPYVFKASVPILEIHKQHNIVTESYGGLTPIARAPGGPLDPILTKIAKRLSGEAGKSISEGQVLQLWLRKKNVVAVTVTRKPERLQEYLAVPNLPEITDAEEKELDAAGTSKHFRNFMKWIDGQ